LRLGGLGSTHKVVFNWMRSIVNEVSANVIIVGSVDDELMNWKA
jgi:hypothetical protein